MCEESQEDSVANRTGIIVSVITSLLILIITTILILAVFLWLRRRKSEPELMDNAAYHSHNTEIKTDVITAHHTNIVTATNEAYTATSVPTSPNPAYQPVAKPRESVDIATETNVAYVATDIVTAVNLSYQPMQNISDNTQEYDYI